MSKTKTHVTKGDTVQVISGNHTGSSGTVLQVITAKDQVIVEGVRLIKKHAKPTQDLPEGGILEREGPIHISNVKLITSAKEAREAKANEGKGKSKGKGKGKKD